MILFINACVRPESRTKRLADVLLEKLGNYEEVNLNNADLRPLNEERLEKRTKLLDNGEYDDPMFDLAKQFASADEIVIAAPYWDGSYPAILKVYLENIYVTGIVSKYGPDGNPVGLCKAKKLYYVTTSGGPYVPDYSYNHIRELATVYFGIPETHLIKAEMLDIDEMDPESILEEAEARVETVFSRDPGMEEPEEY